MESIVEQLKSKKFRGMLIGFGVAIAAQDIVANQSAEPPTAE